MYFETNSVKLSLKLLIELEKAISEDNVKNIKKICGQLSCLSVETGETLKYSQDNSDNLIKSINLVVFACKYNKVKVLDYLFTKNKTLESMCNDVEKGAMMPSNRLETCKNAFYYAMRSGNIELIDILINKWPADYFATHLEELDEILSQAYEELKLKNVLLPDEVQIYVESKLVDLRFFSNAFEQDQYVETDVCNVRERIELVVQNISAIKKEYFNKNVDEKFLFMARFISRNIHILKRQLKSTYSVLPWEEIEFCLVSFVSSYTKHLEINVFYRAVLNKSKILSYLDNFAMKINDENILQIMDKGKITDFSKNEREKITAEIISHYPEFEDLYNDYQQVRDIHSLEKINYYIRLALSVDPKEREGQLIIFRALQVVGEYLKNTLESPNLSNVTSELLLLSLPNNTRKIIIDLRNSFTHANSLFERTEIEENSNVNFFLGVQNDTKKVGDVIIDILYNIKFKMMKILLARIINTENVDEIKEIAEVLNDVELPEIISQNFKVTEVEKIENLFKEIGSTLVDKTKYEEELLKEMNNIISSSKTKSKNIRADFVTQFVSLKCLNIFVSGNENNIDHNAIKGIKFRAQVILKNMVPQLESCSLKRIVELSWKMLRSIKSRMICDNLDEVMRLIYEVLCIAQFDINNISWIKELRGHLKKNCTTYKQKKNNLTDEKYSKQLEIKLYELKNIFDKKLNGQLVEKFQSYKSNTKLQAAVEMLVLDIMSILGTSKNCLENNLLFLDDNTPLLTGRSLRNHLAHDNALVHVLLSDPLTAVFSNAKRLTSENINRSTKNIGKLVRDDTFKLKVQYNQGLVAVTNQQKMFIALEEGNFDSLKNCLKRGADINGRADNLWTALHFAAKGPNLKIIKFIFYQNSNANAKDINGQIPLHIAASFGRTENVEFFIKEVGVYVDEIDSRGRTPLHIAAQNGYKDTVEILLKNKANAAYKSMSDLSPLFYAIRNNHIDIAKVLLEKDAKVDIIEAIGGFTLLHEAAECGHLEIVHFLLQNNADPNAKNDRDWTPLHAAAYNGHLEIVNALILKSADVNAKVINGCTPLYYAVENGNKQIVDILLSHGANVNAVCKTTYHAPLHCAAYDGNVEIVKTLLKNKANATATTVEKMTALHLAAVNGDLETAIALIKHKVDINAKNKNGLTPLHLAVECGHKKTVEYLIKNNAEINGNIDSQFTVLHAAAQKGHEDILELLIKNRANVNAQDKLGRTALHVAAMSGSEGVINLLIQNGAEVNGRANDGITPLHLAAEKGQRKASIFLLNNEAQVNAITDHNYTPLHLAIFGGHQDIVKLLIKYKAEINSTSTSEETHLHVAIEAGYKDIVKILIENGANVNAKSRNCAPLLYAVKYNYKDIVELLIVNGANVDAENGAPLSVAVLANYRDIVEILVKNNACINVENNENMTLLHTAAKRGHRDIVKILIERGAEVDAKTVGNSTPLYFAAHEGYEEVSKMLMKHGANVNAECFENTTPLHAAATFGHVDVVQLLLDNSATVNVKDINNRTPLELAVSYGHLQVVKIILQCNIDINAKGNDDWSLLHIASQEGNLEMVKYLLSKGSDINARNSSGSKPIHIAVREGHKDTVELFLNKGSNINDRGTDNQTLVHYAAMKGHLEVLNYLIAHGANVNAVDFNGVSPMHIAAYFNHKNIIEALLKNGAVFNSIDKINRTKPSKITKNKDIINLLDSTEKLFGAVKNNSSSEVINYIKVGASVSARNTDNATPLLYAAWKGYDKVVNILLQNHSDPNVVGNKGFTALHYAAKFSHIKVVKTLLCYGAVYNAFSESRKTPFDLSVDKSIVSLLKLVCKSFESVKNDNSKVIKDLNKIKDIETIKAVLNARNKEYKTLIVVAMQNNFSELEQLKCISQDGGFSKFYMASVLYNEGNYDAALNVFKSIFEERKKILRPDNLATLDIQHWIAQILYNKGSYQEALYMFEEIFQKQKEMLGLNYKVVLTTGSALALTMHRLGRDDEALNIYHDIYHRQREMLGTNHCDTLDTQFHMALVLERQGKYEEALKINRTYFYRMKELLGENDAKTIRAQNNIAMVLASQGKYEEALEMYQDVLGKKKRVLGNFHPDTLGTLHNIAGVLCNQKKYEESLKAHQELLNIQENILGSNHPATLHTQYNMANVLFYQHKWISALKAYKEGLHRREALLGKNHPSVLETLRKIESIKFNFKLESGNASEVLQHIQKEINIAASNGDIHAIRALLKDGANVNDRDFDGRTALHYAISKGHIGVVKILLTSGADATQVTNKGNTPLHTAVSQDHKEIVKVLIQHVSPEKCSDFINAKTTTGGTTSLHVAAKNGFFDIVKCLLQHGTTYNVKNKEGKTPLDLSTNQKVIQLLKLLEELFQDRKSDNKIISKLKTVKPDEFLALTNARNRQGNTLLQVVVANKLQNTAQELIKMLLKQN